MLGSSAMAVAPPEAMNCWSEDTIERSVRSPATTHAIMGTRVFTGRGVPVILIMAILPRIAPPDRKTSVEGLLFRLDRVNIGFGWGALSLSRFLKPTEPPRNSSPYPGDAPAACRRAAFLRLALGTMFIAHLISQPTNRIDHPAVDVPRRRL